MPAAIARASSAATLPASGTLRAADVSPGPENPLSTDASSRNPRRRRAADRARCARPGPGVCSWLRCRCACHWRCWAWPPVQRRMRKACRTAKAMGLTHGREWWGVAMASTLLTLICYGAVLHQQLARVAGGSRALVLDSLRNAVRRLPASLGLMVLLALPLAPAMLATAWHGFGVLSAVLTLAALVLLVYALFAWPALIAGALSPFAALAASIGVVACPVPLVRDFRGYFAGRHPGVRDAGRDLHRRGDGARRPRRTRSAHVDVLALADGADSLAVPVVYAGAVHRDRVAVAYARAGQPRRSS